MPGPEHPQMEFLTAAILTPTDVTAPAAGLLDPRGGDFTPNQAFLAAACGLLAVRLYPGIGPVLAQADANARYLFDLSAIWGHMALGANRRNEQGAPAPHDQLWMSAVLVLLRQADALSLGRLKAQVIAYLADHLRLCLAFMTSAGPRMPCARAKAAAGQELLPSWDLDHYFVASVQGISRAGLNTDPLTKALLDQLSWSFPLILAEAASSRPLPLRLPIRRWDSLGGGFVAAFDEAEPLNDGVAFLSVSPSGQIMTIGRDLADFRAPSGPFTMVGVRPAERATPPAPPAPPATGPGKDPMDTKTLGQALAVKFPFSRVISSTDGQTVLTGTLSPLATGFYRNRYGFREAEVAGFPSGQKQGDKSSIFWLADLLADPTFLAGNPEFQGVALPSLATGSLPVQWEETDLSMAYSPGLGGAYRWLLDAADHRGLLGPKGPVAPTSTPGAPGVPPPTPAPAPAPVTSTDAAAPPAVAPPAVDRQAAAQKILDGLEILYPGQAARYGGLASLLIAGGKPSFFMVLGAVAPLFE